MRRFRYALFATVVTAAFGSHASATDKPTHVFFDRWTGFYAGVNAGYGGDASDIDISAFNSGTGGAALPGAARRAANTGAIPTYLKTDPHGFVGGFQLGYNWHLMPRWLVGLEADIDFANVRGSDTRTGTASAVGGPAAFSSVATVTGEQKMTWFGTLRPRLGFLVTDGSPGLRHRRPGIRSCQFEHQPHRNNNVHSPTRLSGHQHRSRLRLIDPRGLDRQASAPNGRWTRRWSLKAEYLYVHLGDLTYANSPLTNGGSSIVNTTSIAHFDNNIVRVGLNYKIGSDSGADTAAEAMAAVPHDWMGWYAGLNAGYGGEANNIDIGAFNSATDPRPGPVARRAAETAAIPSYLKTDPHGFVGGLQLGYNWQFTPRWLGGVEADFDFAGIRGSDTRAGTASATATGGPGTTFTAYATVTGDQKVNWFGTLRPRLGFLVTNDLLVYATGGLAFGHVSSNTNLSETTCTAPLICASPNTGRGSASSTRAGWTVGFGTEWAVASHWSLKAEYLYVDLGDLTYANSPLTAGGGASIVNTTSVAHFQNHIVRLGLNYNFD